MSRDPLLATPSVKLHVLPQYATSGLTISFPSSVAARTVTRAQAQAEAQLLSAVACERALRWSEVVGHYTALLKTLSKEELPKDFEPGPYYVQLLFETYYHLAIAFQRQNLHKEALQELNKAIEVASIPKLSCQVGCVSRTFLHTPLFARRAYAYVKCGNLKEAIDDANKAVELDPVNPDIYCVRALVWNTVKERKRALFDLNCSQKLKPFNISTLIIKGAIKKSLMAREDPQSLVKNKDHEKAYILDKESKHFFDVEDFHCPKMADFYDRFLWSLNVPHTIMQVNLLAGSSLMSQLPSDCKSIESCCNDVPLEPSVFNITPPVILKSLFPNSAFHTKKNTDLLPGQKMGSFICSTPTCYLDNSTFARRASYGKTLKESGLKLKGSEISERILRITRAASEWSAKKISSNPVKKDSEITQTSTLPSTSSSTFACKKPEQKKCEDSKTKSKK